MYYVITKNGELVGVTYNNAYSFNLPDVSIHEFEDAVIPDLNSNVWDSEVEQFVQSSDILTRREFLTRFTLQERIGIRASTDPVVLDIMNMLDIAAYVKLTDTTTQQSVGYLASIGLITSARVQEILS